MKIEILCFDGCPTYSEAQKTLRKVLAQEDAEVDLLAIDTDEEARRPPFPSFPAKREDRRPGCRIYATPEGLKGSPTAGMLEDALERG